VVVVMLVVVVVVVVTAAYSNTTTGGSRRSTTVSFQWDALAGCHHYTKPGNHELVVVILSGEWVLRRYHTADTITTSELMI
jgi:hypothetical protein